VDLPEPIARFAADLAGLPGVYAVALGGSRATGTHRPDSDWDLGLYYRGHFDPRSIRGEGYVSALGEWGPIVDGGAWLTVDDHAVDVLFRDLDVVERRVADARAGRFEIVQQNGHLAGAPTYVSAGELAVHVPLEGILPRPSFPPALAAAAPRRWRDRGALMLLFATQHGDRGDHVGTTGMLATAVLCEAHARMAEASAWALTEKGLVERAGLSDTARIVAAGNVSRVARAIGIEPLRVR
jgi:predicted nucleotidyltransferase